MVLLSREVYTNPHRRAKAKLSVTPHTRPIPEGQGMSGVKQLVSNRLLPTIVWYGWVRRVRLCLFPSRKTDLPSLRDRDTTYYICYWCFKEISSSI